MRVLAVLAHPYATSTSGTLFYAAVEQLRQQGITVDVLDLYKHADRIPFLQLPEPGKSFDSVVADIPFYHENKALFMAADRLLIAYPVWWYAVPGIMKAWLDLITNYAWQSNPSKHYAEPRHNITKALIINTASMNWWHRFFFSRNSATEMVKESCKFLGIRAIKTCEINTAKKLSEKQKNRSLEQIKKQASWLAS
jgi:1,4-dihydroxy-2-naphthoate octaprenyltransferase